jgi:membrane protease YdiL (CAAX protease family)
MAPGWIASVPGLFAQAGIAEEILFRGYLFGHLRTSRSFWRAAALSMIPFVAVHLILFATMPWPLALASVLLAAVITVPLACLFEIGGHTIWAPALLHTVIQGAVKIVIVPHDRMTPLALMWMLASAVVPLMILVVPRPRGRRSPNRRADTSVGSGFGRTTAQPADHR